MLGRPVRDERRRLFPDADEHYRGADSRVLLRAGNVDATINAERPKMAPYIPRRVTTITDNLGISVDRANVEVKTAEKLGFVGWEKGISAEAVALIEGNGHDQKND
jgi:2-C-methyl-D-erythritol 2,4-cyclodiphosphate synthase